ncbi:mediator of RNA polymerase II transcription subunit 1-like isoform X2 [Denticeps clupeoides]|nr:mediator of RNA polymerase II transcription subunit 1-like isoform X2 [Denticeps clupeoides]
MVSRLEVIARTRGLGSHLSPTETACYLTADLFYLEVLLQPDGGVRDVKVAQHGEPPVSSASLAELLRMKNFEAFSTKLEDLASLYNIPGDNDTKIKMYTALQFLEKDLLTISHLPRLLSERDVQLDMILNGRTGRVTAGQEGGPMRIQYYISPSDALSFTSQTGEDALSQVAVVTVGTSCTAHTLQLASLIPLPPQLGPLGLPLFSALGEVTSEALPATFLLKLQPPVPLSSSVIQRISRITEIAVTKSDQQWEPLPQLLVGSDCKESWTAEEVLFEQTLPGNQVHRYVLSGSAWAGESWEGCLVDLVPFTHPGHVFPILELLRHQSAANILLSSCLSGLRRFSESPCHLFCELRPESGSSFSVTFHVPDRSSLAVLFVTLADCRRVHCRLFAPELIDSSADEYISRVMTRCMSVPITMRAIHKNLAKAAPCHTADVAEDAEAGPPASSNSCPSPGSKATATPPSSQGFYVMSVTSAPEGNDANTEAPADPCPVASVAVFSH